MLCPDGKLKAAVKYTFCLSFLCCILSLTVHIKNIDFDFSEENGKISPPPDAATAAAQAVFEQALNDSGTQFSKITVCTDKTSDGSIIIIEVIVYSPEPEEKIRRVLENGQAYEVTVINE